MSRLAGGGSATGGEGGGGVGAAATGDDGCGRNWGSLAVVVAAARPRLARRRRRLFPAVAADVAEANRTQLYVRVYTHIRLYIYLPRDYLTSRYPQQIWVAKILGLLCCHNCFSFCPYVNDVCRKVIWKAQEMIKTANILADSHFYITVWVGFTPSRYFSDMQNPQDGKYGQHTAEYCKTSQHIAQINKGTNRS